jgi:hypothetical protein
MMAKVLIEGYRVSRHGGGLSTEAVGGRNSQTGQFMNVGPRGAPPKPPLKATSAIKPAPKK